MSEKSAFAVSGVILAGGQSRRLGRDKAALLVNGQPLLARTVQTLSALSDDLIVVTNTPDRYRAWELPVRFVPDERPGEGALVGVYSGLKAARYPRALAIACDMPFLDSALLRHMLSLADECDVIIPRLGDLLEPLHAIYSKACLPVMARLLAQNRRQIIAFFHQVRVCYVEKTEIEKFDPRHRSFVNVNTAEDWAQVQKLLAGMPNAKRREQPWVTVDVVVVASLGGRRKVLLIERKKPPFAGHWALPGGFVEPGEALEAAARRELWEETGAEPASLEQLHTFGDPGRDPRGWVISVAYLALMSEGQAQTLRLQARSDAADGGWFDLNDPPPLAFDHADILAWARKELEAGD